MSPSAKPAFQQRHRPRDRVRGVAAVDRHHVRRQRIEEQRDVRGVVGERRDGVGLVGVGDQADLAAGALLEQVRDLGPRPAAAATAAGRWRARRWTGRARPPAARASATAAVRAGASSGRRARGSPARARPARATARALRSPPASSRCGNRCGSTTSRQALRRRCRARHANANNGNASSASSHHGRRNCSVGHHALMRASAAATRPRAGRRPARRRAATDSVRCAGAPLRRGDRPVRCADFAINAGEVVGIARAERLAAGEVGDALQAGLVGGVVAAGHRDRHAEHVEPGAIAAEGDGVDAHVVVAREFGRLFRIEHAGGVDAVGEQHQHAFARGLLRQPLHRQTDRVADRGFRARPSPPRCPQLLAHGCRGPASAA